MQTLQEFREDLSWSMLTDCLSESELEAVFESVDDEYYISVDDIRRDFETVICDTSLCSVLEDFSELLEAGHLDKIKVYHTVQEDLYVGVIYYDF